MACRQFKSAGLLYLSNELNKGKRRRYEKHLLTCNECREQVAQYRATWSEMKKCGLFTPSPDVSASILEISRKSSDHPEKKKWGSTIRAIIIPRMKQHPIPLRIGLAVAALAAVFVIFTVRHGVFFWSGDAVRMATIGWQDSFLSEADYIAREIERVDSGDLLSYYVRTTLDEKDPVDFSSPMTGDFESIRDDLKQLMDTNFGI